MNPQPGSTPKIAYDLPGAADAVDISVDYLRREIRTGRLRARRVGRKYLICHADLEAWFNTLPAS